MRQVRAVDLFCGAGGLSRGLAEACEALHLKTTLFAINHWSTAVETHKRNHPWATHLCASTADVSPREFAGRKPLTILGAGVECVFHSRARGGKPVNDQRRSSAWDVVRWADQLNSQNVLVECVPELRDWGPLYRSGPKKNRPIPSKKGQIFKAFMNALFAMGYVAEDRVLRAADYGDPTSRQRLFIMATKRVAGPKWPDPSHFQSPDEDQKGWIPAKDIIDWDFPSRSIFDPKRRPLAAGTIKRIEAGLQKFCGDGAEPFLVMLRGTSPSHIKSCSKSVDTCCPTVTAGGTHIGLAEPFLVPIDNRSEKDGTRSSGDPLGTITTKNRWALCEPFITEINHGTPKGQEGRRSHSLQKPLGTVTAKNGYGLTQPFIVRYKGTRPDCLKHNNSSVDRPLPTVLSRNDMALVQPCLVKYYGTAKASSVDTPLDTVTARGRFGLVEPVVVTAENGEYYYLDICFRMLQPHELAAAMSMGDFDFGTDTQENRVRQIGNAVPVKTAKALCQSLLGKVKRERGLTMGDLGL